MNRIKPVSGHLVSNKKRSNRLREFTFPQFDCVNCGFITEHDDKCSICFQHPAKEGKPVDLYEMIFKLRDELDAAKEK